MFTTSQISILVEVSGCHLKYHQIGHGHFFCCKQKQSSAFKPIAIKSQKVNFTQQSRLFFILFYFLFANLNYNNALKLSSASVRHNTSA